MANNAATEFFGQARDFNLTMGDIVGTAAKQLIKADIDAQQGRMAYYEALLVDGDGKARPPVVLDDDFHFAQKSSDGGDLDEEFKYKLSRPLFTLADLTTFGLDTADIELMMNIHAMARDTSSYKASQKLTASEAVNWGVFSESSKLTATAAESGSSTRSSDYRSKSLVRAHMKRGSVPEGVARLNDFLNEMGDIEMDIMRRKAANAAQKVAQNSDLVDGGDDSGGDSGDSGDDSGSDNGSSGNGSDNGSSGGDNGSDNGNSGDDN